MLATAGDPVPLCGRRQLPFRAEEGREGRMQTACHVLVLLPGGALPAEQ
jgi:hypothetical protein